MPSIGNLIKPLAKSVLRPLALAAAASVTDTAIHEKMFGFGRLSDLVSRTTTLPISNEGMTDLMKIVF